MGNQKPLTREEILRADDTVIEKVETPEWNGGYVYVKGMTAAARGKLEATNVDQRGKQHRIKLVELRERIAVVSVCDENGKLIFTQADIMALGEKSAAPLQRIVEVSNRLSGVTEEDIEEMTEEMEENPFGDSATD